MKVKHNLLGISQLCDNGYNVTFNKDMCIIQNKKTSLFFSAKRQGNLYKIKLGDLSSQNMSCSLSVKEHHQIWHKKIGHANLRLILKFQNQSHVRGLPKLSYQDDSLCEVCQKGKQVKSSFKEKNVVSTLRPLELLHLDMLRSTKIASFPYAYMV